jgi:geranylgeranylglycerol-phosphate geranylgeranyltransferase
VRNIVSWIKIIRINNVLLSFLGVLVGSAVASETDLSNLPILVVNTIFLSVPALAVAAGGYIANDYFDLEIDRISKPWRPLARGDINPVTARRVSVFLYAFSVAYSLLLIGLATSLFVILNVFIVDSYNSRFKRSGFIGNLLVSLATANLFIYGSLSYAERIIGLKNLSVMVLVPYTFAFLLTLVREIIKGVEDIEGDRRLGVRTLATTLGYRRSGLIATILNLIILSLLTIPFLYRSSYMYLILALLTVILSLYASYIILTSRSETEAIKRSVNARSVTKLSLLTGVLAFLLWALKI